MPDGPALVLFPHAGGSAAAYRGLQRHLESDYDVTCVELPGRGRRWQEPFLTSMPAIADFAFEQVRGTLADRPTVLLGHSMGAWVAWLVAGRSRDCPPVHLVVSAARPPHLGVHRRLLSLDPDTFVTELERLGGVPAALRDDRGALDLFLPALRADLAAAEPFQPSLGDRLAVPVTVLRAVADDITVSDAAAWADTTSAVCRCHTLPGGHFHLIERPSLVHAVVRRALAS